MPQKKIIIRDLTLRDGQQSLLATRMTQQHIDRVLPFFKIAGFPLLEVWGGAVPDSTMRFLSEDPWTRLEKIKSAIGPASKLTALSRGRNLFGYNPYPDDVVEGFCSNAIKSGVDVIRTFDALNDIDNIKSTVSFVKKHGGIADAAICYSTDPDFGILKRIKNFLKGDPLPPKIYTDSYFLQKAKEIGKLEPDMITIKDMAGLIDPWQSQKIIKTLKRELPNIPIDLHTHSTPGYGTASIVMAMIEGVDIVDTVLLPFAGGPAASAFEIIYLFAKKLGLTVENVDVGILPKINEQLRIVRKELAQFDNSKNSPIDFHLNKTKLPKAIDSLFDKALNESIKGGRHIEKAIKAFQQIEAYFQLSPPNDAVRKAQVPGGMYSNMLSQLSQLKLSHLFDDVLKVIPQVRKDAGMIPLVTPTSQIVGSQAVNSVINQSKHKPFYSMVTNQFKSLIAGAYGKTPVPISPYFRKEITGHEEEIPYDVSGYQKPESELAQNEKEELLLALFPDVAKNFLIKKRDNELKAKLRAKEMADYLKNADTNKDLYVGLSGNYLGANAKKKA